MYLNIESAINRRMTEDDLPQVMRIINACFVRPYPEEWVRTFLDSTERWGRVIESGHSGTVVSVMLYGLRNGALYVYCLATDPHFQARGDGSKLIEWLKTQLSQDHSHIDLHVYSAEWLPHHVYDRLGFFVADRHSVTYADGTPAFLMRFPAPLTA